MRLYLVRHGETELNRQFRFIGRTDVGLSSIGREQAMTLADRLKKEDITAVYSSNLRRAIQTAETIAQPLSVAVKQIADLREIDFGNWEGMTYDEIDIADHEHFHAWIADQTVVPIPGGESWQHFEHRVKNAIMSVIMDEREGNIIVVSHGGPIKLLMTYFHGDDSEYFKSFWPSPRGLSIVEITGNTMNVLLENDISHGEGRND
ncbi:MAG TPA: histidine phosphatase family protein [Anaerolineae bacterium]|nr:histidine phosphatase family protein [Anaerolineae bacterium]